MSDSNHPKTSEPVPPADNGVTEASSSADDRAPAADVVDAGTSPPVLANFAPLPSVHGVTYSMI